MPLKIYTFEQYRKNHQVFALSDYREEREQVCRIIEDVRLHGDSAIRRYTGEYDQVELADLKVSEAEIGDAVRSIDPQLMTAIRLAKENIERFHRHQLLNSWWDSGRGWFSGQRRLPLESVGIYIPGGTAAYPTTVMMTAVPANLAGVQNIYICTPPNKNGQIDSLTLAVVSEVGASAVFKIGGAQAVAALAYGTETVPAVQKIVGPGNIYVTLAKKEVFGRVGIDMLAGPSEIVVVALEDARPDWIAADLLAQAEHDPLSSSVLITTSEKTAQLVVEHLRKQLESLPRHEIARQSLNDRGAVILIDRLEEAWPIINELAPEHLELQFEEAWKYLDNITSAGAIFIGPYTPVSLGDYWAGLNHVLPTGTAARYASALSVNDFTKSAQVLHYSRNALQEASPNIAALARAEDLEAHARTVTLRRDDDEP